LIIILVYGQMIAKKHDFGFYDFCIRVRDEQCFHMLSECLLLLWLVECTALEKNREELALSG
jgi:hypothetical protein